MINNQRQPNQLGESQEIADNRNIIINVEVIDTNLKNLLNG